ncbi:sodium/hydrogen exchanger 9B1-like isoform X3 [Homalodisca vitripennis]|uniref:sodium/hydrogen exchanger 9B1-like isoform X3 n=1 Tax=Homalodisca vitripennis TaxID=197043 RepID=UPI001EEC1D3B|nr:sodium/hydrogen exchanger 9B1-like isoform X3 [Homalodisca vitripennis]
MENLSLDISDENLTNALAHRRRTVSFSETVQEKIDEVVDILEAENAIKQVDDELRQSFQSQRNRKHSIYSFTSDLPEGAQKVMNFFERLGRGLWNHSDSLWAQFLSWTMLVLLLWAMLYTIVEENVGIDGDLFRLLVLLITAHLVGQLTLLVGLPPLLGMTITGVFLRNIGFYHPAKGQYKDFTRTLKQLATTVGMVRAGGRLVPDAIYVALHCHQSLRICGLGMVPSFLEAMVTAVISYLALAYPPIWALCLGFLLCPNSPAVITPPMEELMAMGYGEGKHVGVLVRGAAGLDVAFSVSLFDICLALLFHFRDLNAAQAMGKGSYDLMVDVVGGCFLGLLAGLLPVQDNTAAVWKRTIAVTAGGMIAIVSGPKVGLPGTGPLSSICTGFVATMLWKLQTPLSSKTLVNTIFQGSWVVLCPILFASTGSDVDMSILDWTTITWMLGIVLVTVIVRLLGCFLVLFGGEFNWKEMLFVGLIFQGKATNQAALAPNLLYTSWKSEYPEDAHRAAESVAMGVLSILVCTPLAHLGARLGGPYLLSKQEPPRPPPTEPEPENTDAKPDA